jgi:hypothetical protein
MKRAIVATVTAIVAMLGVIVWIAPRSVVLSSFVETLWPGAIPARAYAANLSSRNSDLVRESLAHLAARADPVAVPRAIELLQSPDDYVWLSAAQYLGACQRQEAVPYLIKALRHTAWRSDERTVRYLRALTGQDFGGSFEPWQAWWAGRHPDRVFDWASSLGHAPRLAAKRE